MNGTGPHRGGSGQVNPPPQKVSPPDLSNALLFLTIDRPCEEKLERLVTEYNALADRHGDTLAQIVELREALREISHVEFRSVADMHEFARAALSTDKPEGE